MIKSNEQSAILHDAYFNKPPCFIRLFLVRLALLCGLAGSAAYAVMDLYFAEGDIFKVSAICAGAAGVLYILASVLPAAIVYIVYLGAYTALFFGEKVREMLTFFYDYLMIVLDSRLLKTENFTIHNLSDLKNGVFSAEIVEGSMLGFLLVGLFMAFVFTVSTRTHFSPFYSMLVFATAAVPAFMAEIAGFHTSIIFFAAFYFAFYAVRMAYELDGLFVFDRTRVANDALRRNERSYRRRMAFSAFGHKLRSDIPRYLKYSANSIIALIVTFSVMLTAARLIPEGATFDYEEIFSDLQDAGFEAAEKIENTFDFSFGTSASKARNDYFSYSQYGDNSGGIGISEPSDSDRPVLDVTLERNDIPVYLRGDIGVEFSGTEWSAIRDEYEKSSEWDKIKNFYPETQYQITRQKMSRIGYEPDDFLPLQKVSVTYRRKTNVIFQAHAPYDLNYKDSEVLDSYGDTVYRTKGGSGLNTYESLALTPDMDYEKLLSFLNENPAFSGYLGEWNVPGGISNGEYLELIVAYEKYVNDLYGYRDYDEIDLLLNQLGESGYLSSTMTAQQKAEGICRYFGDNFTYSLTVDNGEGAEVLSNFLYNSKQGHCALFATATTLALRELGVPARYVTGYVVSGDGNYTSDGYLYTLREKDLHAWVEVYFEGIGWLPYDPTAGVPGFMETEPEHTRQTMTFSAPSSLTGEEYISSVMEDNPMPTEGEEEIVPDAEATTVTTLLPPGYETVTGSDGEIITPADPQNPVPSENDNRLLPIIITAAAVVLAVSLIALAVYLLVKRVNEAEQKAMNGFKKKNPSRAAAEMYKLIMVILEKEELVPGCEMMGDFAERVDASIFLKGTNVFMVDIMPVFVKCEFGNPEISPVTEEERAAVYKFTSVVYRKYMDKKGVFGRFVTKASLFL